MAQKNSSLSNIDYNENVLQIWKMNYRELFYDEANLHLYEDFSRDLDKFYDDEREALQFGIFNFNKKPKEGIAHLVEYDIIKNDPQVVAEFLFKNVSSLKPSAIGMYLSEENYFNKQVLKVFLNFFEFSSMDLEEAFRKLKSYINFPKCEDRIEQILTQFSLCFTEPFTPTVRLILAYSMVVLNEYLHSYKDDKRKYSVETYINMFKGVNDGADLHPSFLKDIYEKILKNPLPNYDMKHIWEKTSKKGILLLKDELKVKRFLRKEIKECWVKHYSLVYDDELYQLDDENDSTSPGFMIPLKGARATVWEDENNKQCFELKNANGNYFKIYEFDSNGNMRRYCKGSLIFRASNEIEMNKWIEVLNDAQNKRATR